MNIRVNGVLETRSSSYVTSTDIIDELNSALPDLRLRLQVFLEGESMKDVDEEDISMLFPKPVVACYHLIREVI
jgi:hypothetical protein|nr:MAG TPA: hypothetical protein [Caudoviricetes sp.]